MHRQIVGDEEMRRLAPGPQLLGYPPHQVDVGVVVELDRRAEVAFSGKNGLGDGFEVAADLGLPRSGKRQKQQGVDQSAIQGHNDRSATDP